VVVKEAVAFLWRIPASSIAQASVVYLLLNVNRSFELRYFSTKDSGFCRPFPSHIISFNTGDYLLVGHVVSSYVNLLTRDVTSYYLVM